MSSETTVGNTKYKYKNSHTNILLAKRQRQRRRWRRQQGMETKNRDRSRICGIDTFSMYWNVIDNRMMAMKLFQVVERFCSLKIIATKIYTKLNNNRINKNKLSPFRNVEFSLILVIELIVTWFTFSWTHCLIKCTLFVAF